MLFISCLWERQAHILLGWQGGGGGPRDSRVHLHVSPFPWGISALQRVWLAGLLWECPLLRHVTHPSHDQLSLCPLGPTLLPPPAGIPCVTPVSGHITPTPPFTNLLGIYDLAHLPHHLCSLPLLPLQASAPRPWGLWAPFHISVALCVLFLCLAWLPSWADFHSPGPCSEAASSGRLYLISAGRVGHLLRLAPVAPAVCLVLALFAHASSSLLDHNLLRGRGHVSLTAYPQPPSWCLVHDKNSVSACRMNGRVNE